VVRTASMHTPAQPIGERMDHATRMVNFFVVNETTNISNSINEAVHEFFCVIESSIEFPTSIATVFGFDGCYGIKFQDDSLLLVGLKDGNLITQIPTNEELMQCLEKYSEQAE